MIIKRFTEPGSNSLPQQVEKNTDKLEKMSKVYKTTQNLTLSATTIELASTNINELNDCVIDRFIFSRNGLLFKIVAYTGTKIYIEFYSDLSSTNEVITNFEFNPDVVVYENGNARIVGTIKYNQDSLLEAVEAPAEINIPIIAGEGMVVDANEENDKIEFHIDNDAISNPNLLINGDFRVNQRGQSSYTNTGATHTYTVDRWRISVGSSYANTVTVTPKSNGGVNLAFNNTLSGGNTPFIQVLENPQYLIGQTLTFSMYVSAINSGSARIRISNYTSFGTENLKVGLNTITYVVPSGTTQLFCGIISNASTACDCDIEWAKLEVGRISTAISPRPYAEELSLCQRYYITMSNKKNLLAGTFVSTSLIRFDVNLPVTLRTTPTISNSACDTLRTINGMIESVTITNSLINEFNGNHLNLDIYCEQLSVTTSTPMLAYVKFDLDAEIY